MSLSNEMIYANGFERGELLGRAWWQRKGKPQPGKRQLLVNRRWWRKSDRPFRRNGAVSR